jgi:hypothetical protein
MSVISISQILLSKRKFEFEGAHDSVEACGQCSVSECFSICEPKKGNRFGPIE